MQLALAAHNNTLLFIPLSFTEEKEIRNVQQTDDACTYIKPKEQRGILDGAHHLFIKSHGFFLCIVCIRTDLHVFTHQEGCTAFYPSLLPSALSSAWPPWNTVGGSGHSFHCAGARCRARLKREWTVNGHLEDGENICLWRRSGLEIPQWDMA